MKTNQKSITYSLLDDQIHYITLLISNRQAVDDLFIKISEIHESSHPDDMLLYLLDHTNISDLPYRYVMQRAEHWNRKVGKNVHSRVANLYHSNPIMLRLVNVLASSFTKDDMVSCVFSPDKKDDAIAWLKSQV